ncbi:MAG: DUF3018 family protein [Candidatus Competibacteraceae bacterium]|nr:MAG: DUF3018 family protein [Candidatus Competibacteraceae bacterium]
MPTTPPAALEHVRRYRERMKAQGFRQLNLWVPDTRSPRFAEECRRQSRLAARHDRADGVMELLEAAASDLEGWEP